MVGAFVGCRVGEAVGTGDGELVTKQADCPTDEYVPDGHNKHAEA
jgi:hypothetical protein